MHVVEEKTKSERTNWDKSEFDEILSFAVPDFREVNTAVEDFCRYYQKHKKVCPFILADRKEDRTHTSIYNWDITNCMWVCKWFIKQDIPALLQFRGAKH